MDNFLTPFYLPRYIELPNGLTETLGLFVLILFVGWGLYTWREKELKWQRKDWVIFLALIVLTFITSLYVGLRLPAEGALPRPLLPEEPRGPLLMFLIEIPWMLAAGFLGPLASVLIASLAGLLIALVDTHSIYTILQMAVMALLFSAGIRQLYRTPIYRLLRHPLGSALLLGFIYAPLYLMAALFEQSGPWVARVDFGVTRVAATTAAVWVQLLIGGVVAEIIANSFPYLWGNKGPLQPSPTEKSLQLRFFYSTGPYVLLLLFALMVGAWIISGRVARQMLEDQLSATARIAAESIPFFLETGHNLSQQAASDPRLLTTSAIRLPNILAEELRKIPYFRQLYVLDKNGDPVAGYPENIFERLSPSTEEMVGIRLALKGVTIQSYAVPPVKDESTAQISYVTTLKDSKGDIQGVLIGRSDLASNPFTKPIIQALEAMRHDGGDSGGEGVYGIIVDENGIILYHPVPSRVMSHYLGRMPKTAEFFDETGPEGTRNLVYYQPIVGRSWAIILTVPAQRAQQLALTIAVPLVFLILLMAIVAIVSLRLGLQFVTASLQTLAVEAGRISQGKLDHSLPIKGADEVGQLSQAFEQMRVGLKGRLDELNRLLVVSQGVASSLELHDSFRPILSAALAEGACMARVVLAPELIKDSQPDIPVRFGEGPNSSAYAYLDDQILMLTRQRERLILSNLTRGRGLNFSTDKPHPNALIAIALHHENRYYGALWVAYRQPRPFADAEIRFLTTLAGEAALAAANGILYSTAEIGRKRLEAILTSTPDPVLVTDYQNRMLLGNPAAIELIGDSGKSVVAPLVERAVAKKELFDLLSSESSSQTTREIAFTNGKIYYITVSSVVVDNMPVGKVCMFRDITHFKELDALKSDFVATVSHDLRSPLSLIRGYATMMQMVGDLNDQQKTYVRKIVAGVESMSKLINNLLDLGRIEAGVGLQLEMVAITEVVDRVLNNFQPQATQKNINLGKELQLEANPVIEVDPALLQQALYNLVDNAIKYTPVGGQVKVKVLVQEAGSLFSVQDTGPGIAPLDQPRLFEKFYSSGQRDGTQQRGSGLGLAIVRSIAERHGGRVWLESNLGKGSIFYLEIPFHRNRTPVATD